MIDWKTKKRVVVKVGTSTLTYESGLMNLRRIEQLIKVLSDIKNAGHELIFVSSGAIAAGAGKLGIPRPQDTAGRQAAAAVGQCELMDLYDKQFSEYGHLTAQILLTRDGVDDPVRRKNIINTIARLLELGVVPIINENDTVSTEEIEFGDNDTLSAQVAILAKADLLILLTDIDGLYDADPRQNPNATRIERVQTITDAMLAAAGKAGSARGTGGMITKLHAAKLATEAGIPSLIMSGSKPSRLYELLDGTPCGTIFETRK